MENSMLRETLTKCQPLSENDLYGELGRHVPESEPNATRSFGPNDLANAGRAWFLRNYAAIQKRICGNASIRSLIEKKQHKDDLELATLVGSQLIDPFGAIVGAITALLVCRRGVELLCKDFTPDHHSSEN
jgi:hypothetical protein